MKQIITYLFIVFTMLGYNTVNAESCDSRSAKLSEMKFLEMPLKELLKNPEQCTIIPGVSTDAEARAKCKLAVLNPGNPQYVGGKGDTTSNSLGYYFCLNMNKQDMCLKRKAALGHKMDIRWAPQAGAKAHHNSGDCKCKSKDDNASEEVNCPAEAEQFYMATNCPYGSARKAFGEPCKCYFSDIIVLSGQSCPVTEPVPVVNESTGVDDAELDKCLVELKEARVACSEKSKAAIDKCSKEAPDVNKNIGEAQRVLSIGLDAVIGQQAGSGAVAACAKMGAAGTSVIEALSLLKESCTKEIEGCKKGCEDVATLSKKTDEEFADICEAKFKAATPPKEFTTAYRDRLKVLLVDQRDVAVNAEKFCKGDVKKSEGQLDGFLQELAQSVQKADICKCQLMSSTDAADKCSGVAGPLTCIQNINQPGCSFSSVGCSPGSTIAGCRNPVGMTNPNGSGIAMPASGFAGPGFGSGGSGSGNAGKVGLGDSDLSGLYDESRPAGSGTATADAGSPFGVAAGGSGAGGAAGGGGGGAPTEGGGGGEEGKDKSGLSGFFQSAKGGIASLFGGPADNKNAAAKKPDNKAYKNDVNGFRPKAGVRGMAGSNEFGSKNRDIWKTMNERYNDQYHTFITVETPSK